MAVKMPNKKEGGVSKTDAAKAADLALRTGVKPPYKMRAGDKYHAQRAFDVWIQEKHPRLVDVDECTDLGREKADMQETFIAGFNYGIPYAGFHG